MRKEKPQRGPENPEEEFHAENPEWQEIIEALTSEGGEEAVEEAYREAGGKPFRGMSKEEALRDLAIKQERARTQEEIKARFRRPHLSEIETKKAYKEKYGSTTLNPFIEILGRRSGVERNDTFLTNTVRGSVNEILYRVLVERFPEIGVSINEEVTDSRGRRVEDFVRVEVNPVENKKLIYKISKNPLFSVLWMRSGAGDREERIALGKKLEERGEIPHGTSERALARAYLHQIQLREMALKLDPSLKATKRGSERDRRAFEALNVKPLSYIEIGDLLEKMVAKELGR